MFLVDVVLALTAALSPVLAPADAAPAAPAPPPATTTTAAPKAPAPAPEAAKPDAKPDAKPEAKADAKLDALVDQIQKTYDATTDFSGSFLQRYTYTLLRRTQESKGAVVFKKPGLMRWDYSEPQQKAFIVDGKSLWLHQPQDNNAFVNACFQQDGLTASVAFLWGQGKIKEQFDVSWFDGVFGDKTDHHLLLVPKQQNSIFARLILVVDPKSSRVKQSVVVDPQGNVNQFIYSNLKFNQAPKPGVFSFTPPPNTHVQRMPGSCDKPVPGLP